MTKMRPVMSVVLVTENVACKQFESPDAPRRTVQACSRLQSAATVQRVWAVRRTIMYEQQTFKLRTDLTTDIKLREKWRPGQTCPALTWCYQTIECATAGQIIGSCLLSRRPFVRSEPCLLSGPYQVRSTITKNTLYYPGAELMGYLQKQPMYSQPLRVTTARTSTSLRRGVGAGE